jgi:hypothetical protein
MKWRIISMKPSDKSKFIIRLMREEQIPFWYAVEKSEVLYPEKMEDIEFNELKNFVNGEPCVYYKFDGGF